MFNAHNGPFLIIQFRKHDDDRLITFSPSLIAYVQPLRRLLDAYAGYDAPGKSTSSARLH